MIAQYMHYFLSIELIADIGGIAQIAIGVTPQCEITEDFLCL